MTSNSNTNVPPPTEIQIKQQIARAELQKGLMASQSVLDKMMAQLRREGVAPSAIKECLSAAGAQLEHDVRRMESKLQPDSGTTREKAIKATHPLQETLLLNEIGAETLSYKRIKGEDGRVYDEHSVLRRKSDGSMAPDTVWFDITEHYEQFVRLTKRRAQPHRPPGANGVCFGCGAVKAALELKTCAKCKSAFYCDKDCQTNHWHNGHKAICLGFQAQEARLTKRLEEMELEEKKKALEFNKNRKQRIKALKAPAA